jgi:hypothetical protein
VEKRYGSASEVHMRRVMGIVLVLFIACSLAAAGPSAEWSNVQKIKWDTPVRMELWNGHEYVGRFDFADATSFRLKVASHEQTGQTATVQTFAQEDVRIVEVFGGRRAQDPTNTIRAGMLVGATGGAIAGGIASGKAWPVGALAGGFGGAAAGAIGGGLVAIAKDTPRSHRKIVYESHQPPSVAKPPQYMKPSS